MLKSNPVFILNTLFFHASSGKKALRACVASSSYESNLAFLIFPPYDLAIHTQKFTIPLDFNLCTIFFEAPNSPSSSWP